MPRRGDAMDSGAISLGLMVILGLLMISAAISDIRSRKISNELNSAMALLAIPFWIASGLALWPDVAIPFGAAFLVFRPEEHTSELQSLMRTSSAAFCSKKKK